MTEMKPYPLRYGAVLSDVINASRDLMTAVAMHVGDLPNVIREKDEPERFAIAELGSIQAARSRLSDVERVLRERSVELRDRIASLQDTTGRFGFGVQPENGSDS